MSNRNLTLVDTHCHLHSPDFDEDLDQILRRAHSAGVQRIVVPAIDIASCHKVIEMAAKYDQIFAAVGVHPHNADAWDESVLAALSELACSSKVVAIGEIGLDYHRDYSPREAQARAFRDQLRVAAQVGLPVIIHNREASEDILRAILEWAAGLNGALRDHAGVLHAFSGDAPMANQAVQAGFYIGIAGPLTYPNASGLRSIVSDLPLDRMLIETDAPYLPPQAHRGERNEPSFVELIAVQLAEIHALDVRGIGLTTSKNASILFGWEYGNEDSVLF
jgi:TatD DNase family protein